MLVGLATMVVLNLTRCSFEKPSAPSWDVPLTVPLVSKVYTMAEIANDESTLKVDSTSGLLALEVDSELDDYTVGDQLTLESVNDVFAFDFGTFNIDSPGSQYTDGQLREIYPQADNIHGQTLVVPAFNFVMPKKPLEQFTNYSYVVVESGHIDVELTNNLSVQLGSPLTFEVWDTNRDTLVATKTSLTNVPPSGTLVMEIDLNGKRMPNQLSIRMHGFSPGSQGNPVYVDAYSNFIFDAQISDLQVREALAIVPAQVVVDQNETAITDSLIISDSQIEAGQMQISIQGRLPLDTWIVYRLPDFITPSGNSIVDSVFVFRNTSANINIPLANHRLRPQAADFCAQKVRFLWTARTRDSGSQFVLVQSGDAFNANFSLSGLRFSQLTGKVGEKAINISQNDIDFDMPVDLDSIFFETAQMELILNNGINFPARLNLMVEGEGKSGATAEMRINGVAAPAQQPGTPVETRIVLNRENSNINEFISILPTLLRVDGNISLGDPNWVGTVTKNDYVSGVVRITAPFAVRMPPQIIKGEVDDVEIDEEDKEDIFENLGGSRFFAQISNHLPMGASIEILFAQDTTVYDNPVLTFGPIRANSGVVDGAGNVQAANETEVNIELTEEQMQTFLLTPLYSGVRVSVDGSNGKYVRVRASDYIHIKSYGKINVKVNQD
jgi:hypothetical protein